jgi:hypothetical protein
LLFLLNANCANTATGSPNAEHVFNEGGIYAG